jgi:hypothetical protein
MYYVLQYRNFVGRNECVPNELPVGSEWASDVANDDTQQV